MTSREEDTPEMLDEERLTALEARVVRRWETSSSAAAERELMPRLAPQAVRALVQAGAIGVVGVAGVIVALASLWPEAPARSAVQNLVPAVTETPAPDSAPDAPVRDVVEPVAPEPAAETTAPNGAGPASPLPPLRVSSRPSPRPSPVPELAPPAPPTLPTPTSPPATASPVGSEIDLIREARAALEHDLPRALALVDRHRSEFPHGLMGVERTRIEVSALIGLGRLEDAEACIEQLRARDPTSAALPVMTRLLERAQRDASAR